MCHFSVFFLLIDSCGMLCGTRNDKCGCKATVVLKLVGTTSNSFYCLKTVVAIGASYFEYNKRNQYSHYY